MEKGNEMTLTEFYDACKSHDWFYVYSDDGLVVRRGDERQKILREAASLSADHKELWLAFLAARDGKGPIPARSM